MWVVTIVLFIQIEDMKKVRGRNMEDEFYKPEEVAKLLGVSTSTVAELARGVHHTERRLEMSSRAGASGLSAQLGV